MLFGKLDLSLILDELMEELEANKDHFTFGGTSGMVIRELRSGCTVAQVWVEKIAFNKLCDLERVINHPMTDTLVVVNLEVTDHRAIRVELRERNDYFKSVVMENEIKVFDDITLMIHKRNEWSECVEQGEPEERIRSVMADIRELNDILAEKNKVKEVV